MTLEEMKWLWSFTGNLGWGAILGVGIVALLFKNTVSNYLGEKGKNLATKEDIRAITAEVEGVKLEFATQLKEIEHQKTLLTEGFKNTITRRQEFDRTANSAILDLTRKLASGSHVISWLSWHATQPSLALTKDQFDTYDKDMMAVMSELIGAQASVAALDPARSQVLSQLAEELYVRDEAVSKARILCLSGHAANVAQGDALLVTVYNESISFDKTLLREVSGLVIPLN